MKTTHAPAVKTNAVTAETDRLPKKAAHIKRTIPAATVSPEASKMRNEQDLFSTVSDPKSRHCDRELSILAFNRRVLLLAADESLPLLERLKYLCIVSSNIDEFFEVRVPDFYDQVRGDVIQDGRTRAALPSELNDAKQTIGRIAKAAHELVQDQYALYNKRLIPALAHEGIELLHHADRNDAQRKWARDYFLREVQPLLTPIALDPSHPFPQVVNKSLNFIVQLKGKDAFGHNDSIAILKAPRVCPRVIALPKSLCKKGKQQFVLLSSVIRANLELMFIGRQIVGFSQFRVTRDSDMWIDEGEVSNLRQALAQRLTTRAFGNAVRLEISSGCPTYLEALLLQQFGLAKEACYRVEGPVNLVRLNQLSDLIDRPELRFKPFTPRLPNYITQERNVFDEIKLGDVLLHHPFESFDPVIDFLRTAATDPNVLAIKQTIYRTGVNSALMETLIDAARRGKEVTAVVELTARFDEAANINWAERLEAVGVQVVFGVVGLKTHAKMTLVLRREELVSTAASTTRTRARSSLRETVIRRYAHLSTGNYHPATARAYTDFGMLTARDDICDDITAMFMHLTSMSKLAKLNQLWAAPFTLQKNLLRCIERETAAAKAKKPARIIAKVNALTDETTVDALYVASQAGVEIDLVVRGACILRPQVKGLSENIRVRSVLGRFLEHSRIFMFHHGGVQEVYLSSADWMGRNLFRRIEIAWPVLDAAAKARVISEGLAPYLTSRAWQLSSDGCYREHALDGKAQLPTGMNDKRLRSSTEKTKSGLSLAQKSAQHAQHQLLTHYSGEALAGEQALSAAVARGTTTGKTAVSKPAAQKKKGAV